MIKLSGKISLNFHYCEIIKNLIYPFFCLLSSVVYYFEIQVNLFHFVFRKSFVTPATKLNSVFLALTVLSVTYDGLFKTGHNLLQ